MQLSLMDKETESPIQPLDLRKTLILVPLQEANTPLQAGRQPRKDIQVTQTVQKIVAKY